MKLNNKQLATQEAMLLLIHQTDDIEKAITKEIEWLCETLGLDDMYYCTRVREARQYWTMWQDDFMLACEDDNIIENFWKPTLERVLFALWDSYNLENQCMWLFIVNEKWEKVCSRQLLKEDWSPATLRDQKEETQDKIYDLVVW